MAVVLLCRCGAGLMRLMFSFMLIGLNSYLILVLLHLSVLKLYGVEIIILEIRWEVSLIISTGLFQTLLMRDAYSEQGIRCTTVIIIKIILLNYYCSLPLRYNITSGEYSGFNSSINSSIGSVNEKIYNPNTNAVNLNKKISTLDVYSKFGFDYEAAKAVSINNNSIIIID